MESDSKAIFFFIAVSVTFTLCPPATLSATAQTAKPVATPSVATKYISAIQKHDYQTIIDLTYAYQQKVNEIKAQNPQVLWPKLTTEYYDSQIAAFSQQPGFWQNYNEGLLGMTGDPTQAIRAMAGILLPNSKWKVTESRTEHVRDSIALGEYDLTTVYVTVDYPSVDESPFLDGKFLKEIIVALSLHTKTQLVIGLQRLPQGDVSWGHIPFMIFNATWVADGLFGLKFNAYAVGDGKPPFVWSMQCASIDLATYKNATFTPDPAAPHLSVNLNARFPESSFPLPCSLSAKDSAGHADAASITVPKMFTGPVQAYCWARAPWGTRGQVMTGNACIRPILMMNTSTPTSTEGIPEPAHSDSSSGTRSITSPQPPPHVANPACGNYDQCLKAGISIFQSDQEGALSDFQAAANQKPTDGEPWIWIGMVYLASGRNSEATLMADKALNLGYPLAIGVCHEKSFRPCERGMLSLTRQKVSFTAVGTSEALFAVPPSQITVEGVLAPPGLGHTSFRLKADGKHYNFEFIPLGVACQTQLFLQCPPQGMAQQLTMAKYVVQTIPKLASGELGQPAQPTIPSSTSAPTTHSSQVRNRSRRRAHGMATY